VRAVGFLRRHLVVFLLLCIGAADAKATGSDQAARNDSLERISPVMVYPDGSFDWDYAKTNIPYVDYVRDRMEADLYLLITNRMTGAGGIEYTITMVGQGRFAGMNDTLVYCSRPTDVTETKRAGVVNTLKMGLVRYVARTPAGENMTIAYRGAARPADTNDPWDRWVFSLYFSPGVSGSQVDKQTSIYSSFSADRVTPGLKMSFSGYSRYSESEQQLPSKTLNIMRRTNSFNALLVKSVGEHWSVGTIGKAFAQSYMNKKHFYEVAPAIEYSVFPYAESTRRSLAVFSQIDFTDVTYQEATIYDKTSEKLWSYKISLPGSITEPWGSFYSNVTWQQYFHDRSIYRLSVAPSISFQIAKGLRFSVNGWYSRIHDQIDQPRRDLTDEEILLNLNHLASTYDYSFSISVSYTFGSIYSNVVNPRFIGP